MTNKPKAIGTAAESAVVRVLKDAGFRAKRLTLHGSSDVGDVDCGHDAICIEVKGGHAAETASDGQIEKWLTETATERHNAGADIGILVVKRKGIGPANAGQWWAITNLWELDTLMGGANPFMVRPFAPVRVHLDTMVDLLRRYLTLS